MHNDRNVISSEHSVALRLLFHDPQLRFAAATSVIATVMTAWSPDNIIFAIVVTITLPRFLVERATALSAALPISAGTIIVVRLATILGLLWLPFLAWIAVPHETRTIFDSSHADRLGWLPATFLAVALPFLVQPEKMRVSPISSVLLPWIALAMTALVQLVTLGATGTLVALTVASVICAAVLWRRLPRSLVIPSTEHVAAYAPPHVANISDNSVAELSPASVHADTSATSDYSTTEHLVRRTGRLALYRTVMTPSAVLSGIMAVVFAQTDAWTFFVPVYVAITLSRIRASAGWLYSLPISKRTLMLLTVLPAVLPAFFGVAIGDALHRRRPVSIGARSPYTAASEKLFQQDTRVPLDFWHRTSAGTQPRITAPWGEVSVADTVSVLGFLFYNPYSVEKSNSQRFLKWQFERASNVVYGYTIPYDDYRNDRRRSRAMSHGSAAVVLLTAGLFLTALLVVVFLAELPRLFARARWPVGKAWTATTGMAFIIGVFFLDMRYDTVIQTAVVAPVARSAILHLSQTLPGSTMGALVVAATLPIAMLFLLQWQLSSYEFADRSPSKHSW